MFFVSYPIYVYKSKFKYMLQNKHIHICDDIYHTCMDHIYIALITSSTKIRQKKNIALWPGKPTACKSPLKNWLGLEDDFLAGFLLWGWFSEGANYMSVMWNFLDYPTANLSNPRCQSISALASSSSACWSSRWISKTSTPAVHVFWTSKYWGFC